MPSTSQESSSKDTAFAHPDDVIEACVLPNYQLRVSFHDGATGIVDMSQQILSDKSGVFAALRDPDVFEQVGVVMGAVTWPGEIDLAPDAMYVALRENGNWILE